MRRLGVNRAGARKLTALCRPVVEPWTIRRVVSWSASDFSGRGIQTARLDAELLVAHALGIDRVRVYMDLDRPLTPDELGAIRELVARRRKLEPIAYILGRKEFYGRSFEVGPEVLVPRPETELVVERALALLPEGSDARVLDLCTGSGAIAISVALERPGVRVDATDVSTAALALAARNAAAHGASDRVRFLEGDLFAALDPDARYALVLANPPYIADAEVATLAPDVAAWEPHLALAGGPDGLAIVRRIVEGAPRALEPGGSLVFEIGKGQALAVLTLLAGPAWSEARAHQDLARIERVVEARAAR